MNWRTHNTYLLERRGRGVLRTAHAGDSRAAGPNTLEAIRAALAIKPDYIELDVHLTRDGELLLWHDEHIITPEGAFAIREHPLSTLKRLPTPDGTVITLPRAIEELRGHCGAMIDLKAPHLEDALLEMLERLNFDEAIVCGGYLDTLLTMKRARPTLAVSLTPDEVTYLNFRATLERLPELDAMTVYWRTVDHRMLDAAHEIGVLLLAWTVDHLLVAEHLLKLGVDGLTSNNMNLLNASRGAVLSG